MINDKTPREAEDYGDEIISKSFKAGKRTYFFDVHATRNNDYFITITESRKRTNADGTFNFDRHKIYLYKEDFAKFEETLLATTNFIREAKKEFFEQELQSNE